VDDHHAVARRHVLLHRVEDLVVDFLTRPQQRLERVVVVHAVDATVEMDSTQRRRVRGEDRTRRGEVEAGARRLQRVYVVVPAVFGNAEQHGRVGCSENDAELVGLGEGADRYRHRPDANHREPRDDERDPGRVQERDAASFAHALGEQPARQLARARLGVGIRESFRVADDEVDARALAGPLAEHLADDLHVGLDGSLAARRDTRLAVARCRRRGDAAGRFARSPSTACISA
jgi:hypothetical protein